MIFDFSPTVCIILIIKFVKKKKKSLKKMLKHLPKCFNDKLSDSFKVLLDLWKKKPQLENKLNQLIFLCQAG